MRILDGRGSDKVNMSFKKISIFVVIVFGLGLIFELPYIRNSFYIPICQTLNLTNQEFGVLSGIYSVVSMITYIVGGFLSDRITSRWVLFAPFAGTGLLGFWFSSFPTYGELKIIFGLMGITTVMTFFSTAVRIVRTLGEQHYQGRMFGGVEAGKGIVAGVAFFVMQILFQSLGGGRFGFEWVIKAYSIINIIIGLGVVLILPDEYLQAGDIMPVGKQIRIVAGNQQVWIMGGIVFAAYSIYALLSFVPQFFLKAYGTSMEVSSAMSVWRYVIQIVGAILAGYFADRIRSAYQVIFSGFVLIFASLCTFIVLPYSVSSTWIAVLSFAVLSIAVYGMKGLYYALISESSIDIACTGSAVGIIAGIGYLPDTFMYSMMGNWIDTGLDGYYKMFIYAMAVSAAGMIFIGLLLRKYRLTE